MEKWEYAVGHQDMDDSWSNDTDPMSYDAAARELIKHQIRFGDEDWASDLRIIKRSDNYLDWVPVQDHAAELLAEVLEDLRLDFAFLGAGIMQGKDIAKSFRKRAQMLIGERPVKKQEFDQ